MKFGIVMEQSENGTWSVMVPELPGCYSWGATREEAAYNVREAIEGHIEALREFGDPIPHGFDGAAAIEVVDLTEV